MNTNRLNYLSPIIFIFVLLANVYSHSRVAFSRPGSFIRTPSSLIDKLNNKFYVGFSNEWISTKNNITANAIYFKSSNLNGYEYGISYVKRAPINEDSSQPTEFSFHFLKELYKKNNFIINVGIQDIFYEIDNDSQISAFLALINQKIKISDDYFIQSTVGFGTGKIKDDSYDYITPQSSSLDIFVGFQIDTPFLSDRGGLQLFTEYDGNGVNVATQLPMTPKLTLKIGIAHFENFVKFNSFKNEANNTIYEDSPSLIFGIEYAIAEKEKTVHRSLEKQEFCILTIEDEFPNELLSLSEDCQEKSLQYLVIDINKKIQSMNDSLLYLNQQLSFSENINQELNTEKNILVDSLYTQYLNQKISYSEINLGMKHLSQSLKYYYLDNYLLALEEVSKSQRYLPDLAYSYARKGSIYYKLGDIDRATINWNIALQLDPEYTEVRKMLTNIKQEKETLEVLSN